MRLSPSFAMWLALLALALLIVTSFTKATAANNQDIPQASIMESSQTYSPWISEAYSQLQTDDRAGVTVEAKVDLPIVKAEVDVLIEKMSAEYLASPGDRWDLLVAAGDAYARGQFPQKAPDTVTAELCYRGAVIAPDAGVAGLAQMKLLELKMSPVSFDDIAKGSGTLDPRFGRAMYAAALNAVSKLPWSAFQTPKFVIKGKPAQLATYEQNAYDPVRFETAPLTKAPQAPQPPPAYTTDAQNVHDHAVTQVIAKNIAAISSPDKHIDNLQEDQSAREVIEAIMRSDPKELSHAEKTNAIKVVKSLTSNVHSRFRQSEREVLAKVWNKIQDVKSPQEKKNMSETLAKQLSASVENGSVVCSSGKIARMTATLEGSGVEGIGSMRPMWAVRDEIGSLAHKVRERGGTADDFLSEARKTYVQDLGMNPAILEPVLNEYSEHI